MSCYISNVFYYLYKHVFKQFTEHHSWSLLLLTVVGMVVSSHVSVYLVMKLTWVACVCIYVYNSYYVHTYLSDNIGSTSGTGTSWTWSSRWYKKYSLDYSEWQSKRLDFPTDCQSVQYWVSKLHLSHKIVARVKNTHWGYSTFDSTWSQTMDTINTILYNQWRANNVQTATSSAVLLSMLNISSGAPTTSKPSPRYIHFYLCLWALASEFSFDFSSVHQSVFLSVWMGMCTYKYIIIYVCGICMCVCALICIKCKWYWPVTSKHKLHY